MPKFRITAPDGQVYEVTAPEGATQEQVLAYAQANYKPKGPIKRSLADLRAMAGEHDATEGMSALGKFGSGVGKSLVDTFRGLQQGGAAVGDALLGGNRSAGINAKVNEQRQIDADLMGDGYGVAGNVAGVVGSLVTPGVVLKAASYVPKLAGGANALQGASRAFLPTSVRGMAAQGGGLGLLQSVAEDESRLKNGLYGSAGGLLGGVLPKVGAGAVGLLGRPFEQITSKGVDKRVAQILRGEAQNPGLLDVPQPSMVPGVQRTLAEETLDPGIARLERQARSTGQGFDPLDRANNAARVAALESFAGSEAQIRAATKARATASDPLRDAAMSDKGVDMAPVLAEIHQRIAANATRPTVVAALKDVAESLTKADDSIASLDGTRLYIGDLLSGKAGADKGYAKAASKELIAVRDLLNEQMGRASSNYRGYLDAFRAGSQPINRMEIGQGLLARGSAAVPDPVTGLPALLPAAFSRLTDNLDGVAAKATGFKKAKAASLLEPQDFGIIDAVKDDLSRKSFAATAGSGGNSQTFERVAMQDRLGQRLAAKVPGVGFMVDQLNQMGQQRLQGKLAEVLADPAKARSVLARIPANDRRIILEAISRGSAFAGTGAAVSLE